MLSMPAVTADQAAIVEATMLCVSEGRERAEAALRELRGEEAEPALMDALEHARSQLFDIHLRLFQATTFQASAAGQLELAS